MRKILFIAIPFITLFSCGNSEGGDAGKPEVELTDYKSKLSYIAGAEQAKMVTESGDPNLGKLDLDEMLKGFDLGLDANSPELDGDCKNNLTKLYGKGNDFNIKYVKEGSSCIGKIAGSIFASDWTKKGEIANFDLAIVRIGFKHGIHATDTLIAAEERKTIITEFMAKVNEKVFTENKTAGAKMLEEAAKLPGAKVLPNGIVIETLNAGKGGSPSSTDDVKANYTLTNAKGDTLESSFGGETPAFSLNRVIEGWKTGFPNLKKGGTYRMYIPWELAYGAQGGYESLCFYIDFQDFGLPGTLVQPRPQQQGY